MADFKLPDLGEGLTEGEILQWFVAVGDTIKVNDPLVEVETAKAAVEVPSPYAGVVTEILAEPGATVDVGAVIVRVDTGDGAAAVDVTDATAPPVAAASTATAEPKREAVLVGYGVRQGAARRRTRVSNGTSAPPVSPPAPPVVPAAAPAPPPAAGRSHRVLAKPPVRKLARDRGIDLATVVGTGPDGTVTRADVESASTGSVPARAVPAAPRVDTRTPIASVRKATAKAMVASAFTAPHVTIFATVDATETMALTRRLRALPELDGVKVSPLLIVARALILACRKHPGINASWDEAAQEIVTYGGVNLGIAAATPRGLIVPNIKDADLMSVRELATALATLTDTARAGKTTPADMQHGTITITNVGVFGVDSGTPILNPGEAAILCFGAIRQQPWVHEGEIAVRWVTQLSMSVDHRLVDGRLASQALADVAQTLADPTALLLGWS
ncbi:MAG TPA: dihydrolipoamide acetyltransferase family protein [Mycobacteriales bacterium]|nr:dihydrolipoamide acetyltransferase family protein [Mycobacteriales bacterium]